MTLFLVGVIEMIISAFWTKAVTKANPLATGGITIVNIFIWYYVIQTVISDIGSWSAIVPYAAGCAIGAMLGSVIDTKIVNFWSRGRKAKTQRARSKKAIKAVTAGARAYESIR